MAKINEVFGGNSLKAEDLKGQQWTLTIESTDIKEFDDGKKIVLHFEEAEKCLICNKTNANIIAELTGSEDTDDWVGKQVTLIVKKVDFKGERTDAIRVMDYDELARASKPRQEPERQQERQTEPERHQEPAKEAPAKKKIPF